MVELKLEKKICEMVERFFSVPQLEAGVGDDEPQILVVSGPPSSGKSSLLFQFAFNTAAAADNNSVVILCSRRANPPFLSHGLHPSCQPFQRIHIKYVDDEEGITNYFAGFHLHQTFPALLVIDDFGHFFHHRNGQSNPRGRELAIAGALALCQNALTHAKEAGWPCTVLLSDTHQGGDSSRFLYIFKRWASSIYTIRGDGFGSFVLNKTYQCGNGNAKSTAKYSIALQYLVLEAITQDE